MYRGRWFCFRGIFICFPFSRVFSFWLWAGFFSGGFSYAFRSAFGASFFWFFFCLVRSSHRARGFRYAARTRSALHTCAGS